MTAFPIRETQAYRRDYVAGVWFLKQSRGQFERAHAAASQLKLNDELIRIVGEAAPSGARGNVALLDAVAATVDVASTSGGRSSDRVYLGIGAHSATAESDTSLKGAWVAISAGFVSTVEALSAVSLAFPRVLRETALAELRLGEGPALEMLANIRGSAFQYLRMSGHDPDPKLDAPELWEEYRQTPACARLSQSAILWTICHELAHLTQGDCSSRTDAPLREARAERARRVPATFWPDTRAHQDELIADRTAIDIAANSTHSAGELRFLMPGSVIAATAAALDGWNLDRSAVAETHPSAFLRVECLSLYWCDFLQRGRTARQDDKVDLIAMEDFAIAWGMTGWVAGRYREGRDGLGIFGDVNGLFVVERGRVVPQGGSCPC